MNLKEHRGQMVQLLANGSAINASTSRLAHAMYDLLSLIEDGYISMPQVQKRPDSATEGQNEIELSRPQKPVPVDSPCVRPTPSEQRIKQLQNTVKQLKEQRAKDKATIQGLKAELEHERNMVRALPEQSGCRKEDTQPRDTQSECDHVWNFPRGSVFKECVQCGSIQPADEDPEEAFGPLPPVV